MTLPTIPKSSGLRRMLAAAGVALTALWILRGPPAVRLLGVPWRLAAWTLLMVGPGVAVHRFCTRTGGRSGEAVLSGLVLSPVLFAWMAVLAMLAGFSPDRTAPALALLAAATTVTAVLVRRPLPSRPARRQALLFLALAGTLVFVIAFLPFTREWWRVRSDAWFHAAVIAQIEQGGIPPEDPYFAGMPLQYMWLYHVLVLTLTRLLGVDAFWVMAILNAHAMSALALAAFLLAGVFRERFGHRLAAMATLLLGFNAAFWMLLPVKAVRAFRGEVRGWEELRRTYSIVPFDYDHARAFMRIYYNQEFFLDKFMVATAFGIALTCMVAAWYGAASFLRDRRPPSLVILAGALLGMLGFHSLVGFVMLAGIFGGSLLALLLRRAHPALALRDLAVLMAVSLACLLVTTPYLHAVMRFKEREQLFPLSVSFAKTMGIGISCAFVLALAARQRRFWRDASPPSRFFALALLSVTAFCLLIALPGANTYDKLGYFVFMPLAVVGGFSVADAIAAGATRRRRWAVALTWVLLFYLPVNALALAGAFATPDQHPVTAAEARLSAWVRENTPRAAVIIDDAERVPLLVAAPRRYYAGSAQYASQWGYPKLEMSRRLHARRALYAPGELDATALGALGSVPDPLYVVVRPEHIRGNVAVLRRPDLFALVYDAPDLRLLRVDTAACRAAASGRTDVIPPEELIREAGL